jgi:hypothetical protein
MKEKKALEGHFFFRPLFCQSRSSASWTATFKTISNINKS